MSNKQPIESTPCPDTCPTGWARVSCGIKQLVCRAQALFEPLCERDKGALTRDEVQVLARSAEAVHAILKDRVGFSEILLAAPMLRADVLDYINAAAAEHIILPPAVHEIGRGRLTIWNRIGILPMSGLSCTCCMGYRLWAALIIGIVLGKLAL